MAGELAITVRGLVRTYGSEKDGTLHRAVDSVDLDVATGEVFALLGPNGAGKTTTVEILEGYRRRDAGDVSVLGHDPAHADAAVAHAASASSCRAPATIELLTVDEVVEHFATLLPRPARRRRGHRRGRPATEKRRTRVRRPVRRPAAPARRGPRHRRTARAAVPRRADHRLRPRGPATVLGPDPRPERRRHDDPADDALPRGGRAARRPAGRHRQRPRPRGRRPAAARRAGRRQPRS